MATVAANSLGEVDVVDDPRGAGASRDARPRGTGLGTGDWRAHAACRHEDPELFFPPGRDDAAGEQIAAAKAVCARCPVAEECLAFALKHRIRDGIWGGLSDQERRHLPAAGTRRRAGP